LSCARLGQTREDGGHLLNASDWSGVCRGGAARSSQATGLHLCEILSFGVQQRPRRLTAGTVSRTTLNCIPEWSAREALSAFTTLCLTTIHVMGWRAPVAQAMYLGSGTLSRREGGVNNSLSTKTKMARGQASFNGPRPGDCQPLRLSLSTRCSPQCRIWQDATDARPRLRLP
jgi:hypothetical protein